jgi:hypothetical protein
MNDMTAPLSTRPSCSSCGVDLAGMRSDIEAFARNHSPQSTRAAAIYIVSNENWPTTVYENLQAGKAAEGSGHLGISSMRNFDIMVARRSHFGILVNDCKSMERAVAIMLDVVANRAQTRREFCSVLERTILDSACGKYLHASSHRPSKPEKTLGARLQAELQREGSWLSTDEGFAYIQDLAKNGRIFNMRANFCDSASVESVSRMLNHRYAALDSVYWSNVLELTFDCELAGQIKPGDPWSARMFVNASSVLAQNFPAALIVAAQKNDAGQLVGRIVGPLGTVSVNSMYQFTDTPLVQTSFGDQSRAFRTQ